MPRILIAGKHWTARAQLRAQLLEEGFDVEAYEDVQSLDNRLQTIGELPQLLIVDLFESENLPEDIAMLSHWVKLGPMWIMAGHGEADSVAEAMKEMGVERVLFRPVEIGKLVKEIKERLSG